MLRKFILDNSNRFVSRWFVLLIDVFIVLFAFFFSYLLRFNFRFDRIDWRDFQLHLPLVLTFYMVGFLIFKSFSGVIRHTSLNDVVKIFKAAGLAVSMLLPVSIYFRINEQTESIFYVPASIVIIHFSISVFTLLSTRVLFKLAYFRILESRVIRTNVLIYGAGQCGIIAKNTLLTDSKLKYQIAGFIDDNPSKTGKHIEGIEVFSPKKIFEADFLEKKNVSAVVIAIQDIHPPRKRTIIDACLKHNISVKIIPAIKQWIDGELSSRQIKNVRIDDLLGREPISLDKANIAAEVKGNTILVTGAAGSIGSEICRQIMHYQPKKLVLVDQAESALYAIEFELKQHHDTDDFEIFIGDIRNKERMRSLFEEYNPDMVFHAAAYKHVPMMENHPIEGVSVNVFGTKNIADLSFEYGVTKFVMVSTDKAVNPTNVMGATKRVAEIYTQSLNFLSEGKTKFITTRFGNVLGSNGSVIPLFRKQIENGGPVMVTHQDITRYFMTIPEACQLVLEAGMMGEGGEIFVFDMGESVRIYDLAEKMVKLSGLEVGKDIEIKITGLRPGEKLYEELLNVKENTLETHHPKIMKGKVRTYDMEEVRTSLSNLEESLESHDDIRIVGGLKGIVPEYISNNSIYEQLDKEKK